MTRCGSGPRAGGDAPGGGGGDREGAERGDGQPGAAGAGGVGQGHGLGRRQLGRHLEPVVRLARPHRRSSSRPLSRVFLLFAAAGLSLAAFASHASEPKHGAALKAGSLRASSTASSGPAWPPSAETPWGPSRVWGRWHRGRRVWLRPPGQASPPSRALRRRSAAVPALSEPTPPLRSARPTQARSPSSTGSSARPAPGRNALSGGVAGSAVLTAGIGLTPADDADAIQYTATCVDGVRLAPSDAPGAGMNAAHTWHNSLIRSTDQRIRRRHRITGEPLLVPSPSRVHRAGAGALDASRQGLSEDLSLLHPDPAVRDHRLNETQVLLGFLRDLHVQGTMHLAFGLHSDGDQGVSTSGTCSRTSPPRHRPAGLPPPSAHFNWRPPLRNSSPARTRPSTLRRPGGSGDLSSSRSTRRGEAGIPRRTRGCSRRD